MTTPAKVATLTEIRNFFGIESAQGFRQEWMALDESSRVQLKNGIGDGTLTY